ncbi:hypothetical protein [Frankia sp. ArI3]|uniref:hypothetical protein n=2 Tax=unclassified Frankia TaxID=2632575 RepID=UPI001C6FC803|nr:hypothetical protein [Frankia sp. ArI3]
MKNTRCEQKSGGRGGDTLYVHGSAGARVLAEDLADPSAPVATDPRPSAGNRHLHRTHPPGRSGLPGPR